MSWIPFLYVLVGTIFSIVWMGLALGAVLSKMGMARSRAWIPVLRHVAVAQAGRVARIPVMVARSASTLGVAVLLVALAIRAIQGDQISVPVGIATLVGAVLFWLGALVGWVFWIVGAGTIGLRLNIARGWTVLAAASPHLWAAIIGWANIGTAIPSDAIGRAASVGAAQAPSPTTGDPAVAAGAGSIFGAGRAPAQSTGNSFDTTPFNVPREPVMPAAPELAAPPAQAPWPSPVAAPEPMPTLEPVPVAEPAPTPAPSLSESAPSPSAPFPSAPSGLPAPSGPPATLMGAPAIPPIPASAAPPAPVVPPTAPPLAAAPPKSPVTPTPVPPVPQPTLPTFSAQPPASDPESEGAAEPVVDPARPVSPYITSALPPVASPISAPGPTTQSLGDSALFEAESSPEPEDDETVIEKIAAPASAESPDATSPAEQAQSAPHSVPAPDRSMLPPGWAGVAAAGVPVPPVETTLEPVPMDPVPPVPPVAPAPVAPAPVESAPVAPAPLEPTPPPSRPAPVGVWAPPASSTPAAVTADQTPASAAPTGEVPVLDDGNDFTVVARRRRDVWVLEVDGGDKYPLAEADVSIGRVAAGPFSGGHVGITDATRTMSKRHARLRLVDGAWMVSDLGSTNGTFVRGEDGREVEVAPGAEAVVDGVLLLGDLEARIVNQGSGRG